MILTGSIGSLLLSGCASSYDPVYDHHTLLSSINKLRFQQKLEEQSQNNNQELSIVFSPGEFLLKAEQTHQLMDFFKSWQAQGKPAINLQIAPSQHSRPFQSLNIARKRYHRLQQVMSPYVSTVEWVYSPENTPDTVVLRVKGDQYVQ